MFTLQKESDEAGWYVWVTVDGESVNTWATDLPEEKKSKWTNADENRWNWNQTSTSDQKEQQQ